MFHRWFKLAVSVPGQCVSEPNTNVCATAHRLTVAKHWLCCLSLACGRVGTPSLPLASVVSKAVMPGALAMVVRRPLSGALGLTALPVSASDPAPKPRTRGQ